MPNDGEHAEAAQTIEASEEIGTAKLLVRSVHYREAAGTGGMQSFNTLRVLSGTRSTQRYREYVKVF